MSGAKELPSGEVAAGSLFTVTIEGEELPYRVLSWKPPRLLLAQGADIRVVFLAETAAGLWIGHEGTTRFVPRERRARSAAHALAPATHDDLSSPMPGRVLEILVKEGDRVQRGARLLVIEAMKMEHPLRAPRASTVVRLHTRSGASVAPGETLIELEESTP